MHVLAGLLHQDHVDQHRKHPGSRDTTPACASPRSSAWAASPDVSREDGHGDGGQWGVLGFEKRLRCVGGIRWVLLQLRTARFASARELLYSVPPTRCLGSIGGGQPCTARNQRVCARVPRDSTLR